MSALLWGVDVDQLAARRHLRGMLRAIVALSILCVGCGSTKQPEWTKTVAAYEVPLPSAEDKSQFLGLLRMQAAANGYHVDAATQDELRTLSDVSPITFNAAVWRGKDDNEAIASAMDFKDHIGRIWLTFSRGQDPKQALQFRKGLMHLVEREWPRTTPLPIMPNGSIPLDNDLNRAGSAGGVGL